MRPLYTLLGMTASGALLAAHLAYAADPGLPALPGVQQLTPIADTGKPSVAPKEATPAQPAVVTPAANVPALPSEQPKTYSFGSFPYSIFFTSSKIAMMRLALTAAENRPGLDTLQISQQDAAAPAAPAEPATYPVYYLDSVVYRTANDWVVWVSGKKITPTKNDTDLKVIALNSHEAMFVWEPEYQQALMLRNAQRSFAPVAPLKHRLVTGEQKLRLDETKGVVTFSLRPNQTFAPAYMALFEGNIKSPQLPPLSGLVPATANNAEPDDNAALPPANGAAPADATGGGGLAQDAINRMAEETPPPPPVEPTQVP